jgi:D-alanyl-D-alanine carboxypeptidase/D-alanyl-D-alanine-endopeptidase (penicillin-binding protein 4)
VNLRPLVAVPLLALAATLVLPAAGAAADDDTREPVVAAAPPAPPSGILSNSTVLNGTPRNYGPAPGALPAAITAGLTATARSSTYLKGNLSGVVIEPASGRVLWRHNEGRLRMPASTQKLLTTYTVLRSMPASTTLTTRVHQSSSEPWRIYLRGGADPSLTPARLAALASGTATRLQAQHRSAVTLYVDTSILPPPTPASGWKASYLKDDVQPVQGLPLAGHRGGDPALAVGALFAKQLTRYGITVSLRSRAVTPTARVELATTSSAPISRLLADMLAASNNDYAEFLLRHAALARGVTPSWRGALRHQLRVLTRGGIPVAGLRTYDGSGLSRHNRVPVATLAAVVRTLWSTPDDAAVVFAWGAVPRAGQTGTLATRYHARQHRCARGLVLAKTGTLNDVVALAGVARSVDGRDRVFVFMESGWVRRNTAVRFAVDTLATTVVGCALS